MPTPTTFESYLKREEEFISQSKLNNLMRILGALHSQASLHPENPYLTIKSIRELTNLQPSQVVAAMNQEGMKVLFTGKGIAFGLSNTGEQVVTGERQLSLAGISKSPAKHKTIQDYVQPMTKEEFAELTDDDKAAVRKVNKYVSELLIKHLSPIFNDPNASPELKLASAGGIVFETQRTLSKLVPRHPSPNVHELANQINTAKPTISAISPLGLKEPLDQASVIA